MSEEKGYARLSASKSKTQPILCSQCHFQFGYVWDESYGSPVPPPHVMWEEPAPRAIYLWGGWRRQPVNGVVSFTKHALERLRSGKVPRNRRGDENGEHIAYSPTYDLPAVLLCPQCGGRQILDKDRLDADRAHERLGGTKVMKVTRGSVGRSRA